MFILCFVAATGPPLNVTVIDTSSTTLQVTWDPPSEAETHGLIHQYDIQYRQVDCTGVGKSQTNGTNPANGTNALSWSTLTTNGSLTYVELNNLTKWSCYEVQVRAVPISSGVWSETKEGRTREDGKKVYSCIWIMFETVLLSGVLYCSALCKFFMQFKIV